MLLAILFACGDGTSVADLSSGLASPIKTGAPISAGTSAGVL